MEQQHKSKAEIIESMNQTLDRMEARIDEMNKMLSEIMDELNRYKQPSKRTITTTYDGEIMFRYKNQ